MPSPRKSLALYLLLVLSLPLYAADKKEKPLDRKIETILSQPDVARAMWGVEAVDLDTGKTV